MDLDYLFDWGDWETLALESANGIIGTLSFMTMSRPLEETQGLVKRVWKITEKFEWYKRESPQTKIEIGGGREADTEVEWQRMLKL